MPDVVAPSTPVLISPTNNSLLSTSKPEFIWQQSTDNVGVSHYQLYIDGQLHIDQIAGSGSSGTFSFGDINYQLTFDSGSGYFHLDLLTSLADGAHTWKIAALDAVGNSADSATWSFTVDSTAPTFVLTQIGEQTVSISAQDASTVPEEPIELDHNEPQLVANGEANSQVDLTVIIPDENGDSDSSEAEELEITQAIDADGNWAYQLPILPRDRTITLNFIITDQAMHVSALEGIGIIIASAEIIIPVQPTTPVSPGLSPSPGAGGVISPVPSGPSPGVSRQPSQEPEPIPSDEVKPSLEPSRGAVRIPYRPPKELVHEVAPPTIKRALRQPWFQRLWQLIGGWLAALIITLPALIATGLIMLDLKLTFSWANLQQIWRALDIWPPFNWFFAKSGLGGPGFNSGSGSSFGFGVDSGFGARPKLRSNFRGWVFDSHLALNNSQAPSKNQATTNSPNVNSPTNTKGNPKPNEPNLGLAFAQVTLIKKTNPTLPPQIKTVISNKQGLYPAFFSNKLQRAKQRITDQEATGNAHNLRNDVADTMQHQAGSAQSANKASNPVGQVYIKHPGHQFPSQVKRPDGLSIFQFYQGQELRLLQSNFSQLPSYQPSQSSQPKSTTNFQSTSSQIYTVPCLQCPTDVLADSSSTGPLATLLLRLKLRAADIASFGHQFTAGTIGNLLVLTLAALVTLFTPSAINLAAVGLYLLIWANKYRIRFLIPSIQGRVVDHQGQPVNNVVVKLMFEVKQRQSSQVQPSQSNLRQSGLQNAASNSPGHRNVLGLTVTNHQGRFKFSRCKSTGIDVCTDALTQTPRTQSPSQVLKLKAEKIGWTMVKTTDEPSKQRAQKQKVLMLVPNHLIA
jgi:hypothetical protein